MEDKYQESLDFLYSQLPMFSRVGAAAYKPGLERVERLSEFYGHPERRLRAIHVAGTNGKGSTSHIIAAVLQAAGYKTALYTSPHLVDFRERIRIDGRMIPEEKVTEFVDNFKSLGYPGDKPSFFELTMIMAFDWFAREEVDYAVIETGMGGRLDSTNILRPMLCVITNISPDHTQFLGHTLPEIAAEKAGIIKEGVPVVIGEADEETEGVFHAKAAECGAPVTDVYKSPGVWNFRLKEDYSGWRASSDIAGEIETDLAGDYQQKNIPTALAAVSELIRLGVRIPVEAIREGVANAASMTGLAGRWQITSRQPLTICDTGHNIGGLEINMLRLRRLKEEAPEGASLRMVIGFVADKAIDDILKLFPKDAHYYLTNAAIPRALPVSELSDKFREAGLEGVEYPDVASAIAAVMEDASPEDIIYIGGSTFIVAEALPVMCGGKEEK
ncbi:MAG: bifunctional folylpolyglutamate synthase/dihydrofolate synthase [Muribaculaceae bacterium]|nr:bifunctional folylpolyglutamate synthase/dihydrofolate synthase [Muribaculaceae bacterium]